PRSGGMGASARWHGTDRLYSGWRNRGIQVPCIAVKPSHHARALQLRRGPRSPVAGKRRGDAPKLAKSLTCSCDDLYRLTSVAFPGSRTVSYGYHDAGRRTSITYPGGTN